MGYPGWLCADAFHQADPDKPGCIRDPDQDAKGMLGIIVQGSCPTDCAHPKAEATQKYKDGDPLKRTEVKLGNSLIPELQKSGHQNAVWALHLAGDLPIGFIAIRISQPTSILMCAGFDVSLMAGS
jgi:hypothetical protein